MASLSDLIVFLNSIKVHLESGLVQFFSNFLATMCAGLFLYFCLEKRIKKELEKNETKRMFKILVEELVFNHTLAEKIIEDEKEYLGTDTFTVGKYRTQGLISFWSAKPLGEEKKFPYTKLLGLIHKLEGNNTLIQLVFSAKTPRVISANKRKVLGEARVIIAKTAELLRDNEKFRKELGIRNKPEK